MGWQDNAAWNELYRQYRLQEQELACAPKDGQKKTLNHRGELDRLIDAALYIAPESKISKEAATALYHEVITGSVSQFEKFSACPFAYYMQYGLQLEERIEHEVQFLILEILCMRHWNAIQRRFLTGISGGQMLMKSSSIYWQISV